MRIAPRIFGRAIWLVAIGWGGVVACSAAEPDDAAKGAEPPAYGEFLVIPLRVHILKSTDLPEIDCALTDPDVERIVGKVNAIWHHAGIHWNLEPLIREPAAEQEAFKARREKGDTPLDLYASLAPKASRSKAGVDVYYIHRFSVNGVYLGGSTAFVQETAKLREVEGGIDEPLPRVTAHELGHALGLPHRQARTNLLASGTTGTTLNAAEAKRAREVARKRSGTRTVTEQIRTAKDATTAGRFVEARRLWADLAAIPGEGSAEAARRRDAVSTEIKRN